MQPPTNAGTEPSQYDPPRSVRVSDAIWNAARERARQDDVTISRVVNLFLIGYGQSLVDLPTVTYQFESPGRPDAGEDAAPREPAPAGGEDQAGIEATTRVVDLSLRPSGHLDPEIFESVQFEDQHWTDIRTVRQLLDRVSTTLWQRDSGRVRATSSGADMVTQDRKANTRYLTLDDETLLYAHWATHYLLDAVQEFIVAFELQDSVTVRLRQPLDETVKVAAANE